MATDAAGVTGLEAVLVFRETPMYLAINKDSDPDLIKDLNAAYQTMLESGEIDTISHSYGL